MDRPTTRCTHEQRAELARRLANAAQRMGATRLREMDRAPSPTSTGSEP